MKVFISQPMNGLSEEEILGNRDRAIKYLKKTYGEDVDIIDSYFGDNITIEATNEPAYYLGKSIEMMADADLVFFAKGWKKARGCCIEEKVASEYGIARKYEEEK